MRYFLEVRPPAHCRASAHFFSEISRLRFARRGTRRGKAWYRIRDLFADERCSQAILDFLSSTHVRRRATKPAEKDARSKASEWELRERNEWEGE